MTEKTYFSSKEAARYMRVSPRTLESWRRKRTGPEFSRVAQNKTIYKREDLDTWLKTRKEVNDE